MLVNEIDNQFFDLYLFLIATKYSYNNLKVKIKYMSLHSTSNYPMESMQ